MSGQARSTSAKHVDGCIAALQHAFKAGSKWEVEEGSKCGTGVCILRAQVAQHSRVYSPIQKLSCRCCWLLAGPISQVQMLQLMRACPLPDKSIVITACLIEIKRRGDWNAWAQSLRVRYSHPCGRSDVSRGISHNPCVHIKRIVGLFCITLGMSSQYALARV